MMIQRTKSKIIFSGLEGSGKSLRLAHLALIVLNNNVKFLKVTFLSRPIYTNIKFSSVFKDKAALHGIEIKEWSNLEDLVGLEGCDIFIDEIGTYFDSRLWAELPLSVRRWIAQCDKNGVNIYGTAQDFAQVDKSFRRLVSQLFQVKKLMGSSRPHKTYPTVKYPWGVFMMRSLSPKGYKEDDPKIEKIGWPSFFTLNKEDYNIYSTNQSIAASSSLPLRHLERKCVPCGFIKVTHT